MGLAFLAPYFSPNKIQFDYVQNDTEGILLYQEKNTGSFDIGFNYRGRQIPGRERRHQQATELVKGYFGTGTTLLYAIGAVVGLVGAVKVYNKWNSGDGDTNKVAAAWFGSCIFLVVVATVLKSFFGV